MEICKIMEDFEPETWWFRRYSRSFLDPHLHKFKDLFVNPNTYNLNPDFKDISIYVFILLTIGFVDFVCKYCSLELWLLVSRIYKHQSSEFWNSY